MALYELIFEVDSLDEATTEAVYAGFDALVSDRGDTTTLTITAEGSTAPEAAKRIVDDLTESLNVGFHRLVEDLVTRADIAQRSGTTPQAVGLWINGNRRKLHRFPSPFNRVGGGVWLWSEVNDWLRRAGKPHDSDLNFPARCDYAVINAWISDSQVRKKMATIETHVQVTTRRRSDVAQLVLTAKSRKFEDWATLRPVTG